MHMECIERMMLREHHLLKDNNQFLTVDFFCLLCTESADTRIVIYYSRVCPI